MVTVVPIADVHAIKTVSFGLEWQNPLQEEELTFLRALHPKVRDELPRVTKQEGFAFQVVVGQTQPEQQAPPKPQLDGITFDALQPNGQQAWSLVIQKHFLAVSCHVYTRWEEIWGKAQELLMPFVPVLVKERGISVIGLQYVDQFRITGEREQFRAAHLFRSDSPFIPSNAYELDDLWHSHHGFFQKIAEPAAHRRLNNIDVDVLDANNERIIQITTAHRAILDEPAVDASALMNEHDGGELHRHVVELHTINKTCLRRTLTTAMCAQIGLGEQS
jgi:uncharacterized protein (TIGR04255 family)